MFLCNGVNSRLDDTGCSSQVGYICELIPSINNFFNISSSPRTRGFLLPQKFVSSLSTQTDFDNACINYAQGASSSTLVTARIATNCDILFNETFPVLASPWASYNFGYWNGSAKACKRRSDGLTVTCSTSSLLLCVVDNPCVSATFSTVLKVDCTTSTPSPTLAPTCVASLAPTTAPSTPTPTITPTLAPTSDLPTSEPSIAADPTPWPTPGLEQLLNDSEVGVFTGYAVASILAISSLLPVILEVISNSSNLLSSFRVFDNFFEEFQFFVVQFFLEIDYPQFLRSFFVASSWALGFLPVFFVKPSCKHSSFEDSRNFVVLSDEMGYENSCSLFSSTILLYFAAVLIGNLVAGLFHFLLKRRNVKQQSWISYKTLWILCRVTISISLFLSKAVYVSSFGILWYSASILDLMLAVSVILICVILLPTWIGFNLRRFTGDSSQESMRIKFAAFIKSYKLGRLYFALLDLASRLVYAMVVVIPIPALGQCILLSVLNLSLLVCAIVLKPYNQDSVYWFKVFAYGTRALSPLLLIPFAVKAKMSKAASNFLEYFQITLVLLLFAVGVGFSIYKFRKRVSKKNSPTTANSIAAVTYET